MKFAGLLFRSFAAVAVLIAINSCDRTKGCTDPNATNYNADAKVDNGTCQYGVTFYFDENAPSATVNMNNQTSMVTGYYTGGAPSCAASGCAYFSLLPGSYPYTATSSTTSWSGTVVINGGACQVILLPQSSGVATFYFDQNGPNATVTVNGQTGTITANYTGAAPTCGISASGCANFILPVGSYNYTASSITSTWSGTVNITAEGCTETVLPQSTGSVTFWTASNNYGNITVTLNGAQSTITSYLSGTPVCGFAGCASFNFAPGVYNYSAVSQTNATWSGSVNLTADGCQTVQLQ